MLSLGGLHRFCTEHFDKINHFQFEQVDVIRPPHKEKLVVPCQPGLVRSASGELYLLVPYNQTDTICDLETFSRLWVTFVLHQTMEDGWHPTVYPPHLDGNARVDVFATHSVFRPNPVGISLAELRNIRCHREHVILELDELDLVDDTPVVDTKSYPPFAESLPDVRASYVRDVPKAGIDVTFGGDLAEQLPKLEQRYPHLRQFITEALAQGPRPAYRRNEEEGKTYIVWLLDFNVR